jgi:hypothetical protein
VTSRTRRPTFFLFIPPPQNTSSSTDDAETLRSLQSAFKAAIHIGAPTYNRGDHRGCAIAYTDVVQRQTESTGPASLLLGRLKVALKARLLSSGALAGEKERAWYLRHTLDAVINAPRLDAASSALQVLIDKESLAALPGTADEEVQSPTSTAVMEDTYTDDVRIGPLAHRLFACLSSKFISASRLFQFCLLW